MAEERKQVGYCACGAQVSLDELDYWGECPECRLELPIRNQQKGDNKEIGAPARI